jgi:hypothetical protein
MKREFPVAPNIGIDMVARMETRTHSDKGTEVYKISKLILTCSRWRKAPMVARFRRCIRSVSWFLTDTKPAEHPQLHNHWKAFSTGARICGLLKRQSALTQTTQASTNVIWDFE